MGLFSKILGLKEENSGSDYPEAVVYKKPENEDSVSQSENETNSIVEDQKIDEEGNVKYSEMFVDNYLNKWPEKIYKNFDKENGNNGLEILNTLGADLTKGSMEYIYTWLYNRSKISKINLLRPAYFLRYGGHNSSNTDELKLSSKDKKIDLIESIFIQNQFFLPDEENLKSDKNFVEGVFKPVSWENIDIFYKKIGVRSWYKGVLDIRRGKDIGWDKGIKLGRPTYFHQPKIMDKISSFDSELKRLDLKSKKTGLNEILWVSDPRREFYNKNGKSSELNASKHHILTLRNLGTSLQNDDLFEAVLNDIYRFLNTLPVLYELNGALENPDNTSEVSRGLRYKSGGVRFVYEHLSPAVALKLRYILSSFACENKIFLNDEAKVELKKDKIDDLCNNLDLDQFLSNCYPSNEETEYFSDSIFLRWWGKNMFYRFFNPFSYQNNSNLDDYKNFELDFMGYPVSYTGHSESYTEVSRQLAVSFLNKNQSKLDALVIVLQEFTTGKNEDLSEVEKVLVKKFEEEVNSTFKSMIKLSWTDYRNQVLSKEDIAFMEAKQEGKLGEIAASKVLQELEYTPEDEESTD